MEHEHDENGMCVTHDGSNHPQSIPNLRQRILMEDAHLGGKPTLAEDITTDDTVILKAAVWYRPTYRDYVSEQAIHERVAYWFSIVNKAFRNSDLNVRVEPVFVNKMDYDVRHLEHLVWDGFEDWFSDNSTHTYHHGVSLGDSPVSLYSNLMENGDTGLTFFSDEFELSYHELTQAYGADLHVWFQEGHLKDLEDGPVGTASTLGALSAQVDLTTIENSGASFNEALRATGYTLTHEIGHNLGLYHEPESYADGFEPRTGMQAFAYGGCGDRLRTVMWSRGGVRRALNFSNPDVYVDGRPCGDPVYSDQASVVRETAPIAATRGTTPDIHGSVTFEQHYVESFAGRDTVLLEVVRDGDLEQSSAR
jgi:hypothetical protein